MNNNTHSDRRHYVIDDTRCDIKLTCPPPKQKLGRPDLTLLIDSNSREILFASPSFNKAGRAEAVHALRSWLDQAD